jgi:hypothetical protein
LEEGVKAEEMCLEGGGKKISRFLEEVRCEFPKVAV